MFSLLTIDKTKGLCLQVEFNSSISTAWNWSNLWKCSFIICFWRLHVLTFFFPSNFCNFITSETLCLAFFFDFNHADETCKNSFLFFLFFIFWENKHFENTLNWKHFLGQCAVCTVYSIGKASNPLKGFSCVQFGLLISLHWCFRVGILFYSESFIMVLWTCNPLFAS